MILNELMELPEYMHSPSSTVEVLFGEDYPVADYTDLQTITLRSLTITRELK